MTEKATKLRFVLPSFVDWFPYFFSLIPLFLLEWKIYDHEFHETAGTIALVPKHPLLAFSIPLLILVAGWQEYRNFKSDITERNDVTFVLNRIKERILSIISAAFVAVLLLLIIY